MVEMTETANILHNATANSLVLMDEIGRGTSTFDGLSLAWSAAIFVAEKLRAYTLFATHYFELTALADSLPNISNVHLDAAEHDSGIVFLHSVKTGRPIKAMVCKLHNWRGSRYRSFNLLVRNLTSWSGMTPIEQCYPRAGRTEKALLQTDLFGTCSSVAGFHGEN